METTTWQEKADLLAQKARAWIVTIQRRTYIPRDLAILFLLSLCVGFLVKSLLHDTLTIGFDDYTLAKANTVVDLNALQKDLIKNGGSLAASGEAPPQGQTCREDGER